VLSTAQATVCAVDVLGDTAVVPLYRRDGSVADYALVDPSDHAAVTQYRWCLHPFGYAVRSVGPRSNRGQIRMHRTVMGLELGDPREVDHENRDRLDNRRANLRIVTRAQNLQNVPARGGASRHRGVTWDKRRDRWQAQAKLNGRQHFLGYFRSETDAAEAAAAWRAEHMTHAID
jgi:hypothetical protein